MNLTLRLRLLYLKSVAASDYSLKSVRFVKIRSKKCWGRELFAWKSVIHLQLAHMG